MEKKLYQLDEIAEALNQNKVTSMDEVYLVLNIDPANLNQEQLIEQLFSAATNPNVMLLPKSDRLAIIKTCQEYIGTLFQQALILMKSDD